MRRFLSPSRSCWRWPAVVAAVGSLPATPVSGFRHAVADSVRFAVATPSPSPTGCSDLKVNVTTAPVTRKGPYGVMRSTGSAAVALTFDDGPDPVNTPAMLPV